MSPLINLLHSLVLQCDDPVRVLIWLGSTWGRHIIVQYYHSIGGVMIKELNYFIIHKVEIVCVESRSSYVTPQSRNYP